ncbi:MAG: helix-turn-helix domain-containing protein [Pseudohongiellaceae bacterium]
MSNPLLLFTAQIVAITSILLLATGYLKNEPKAASARVFAVMAVFVSFYLFNGMAGQHIDPLFRLDLSAWQLVLNTGTAAVCGLFMIYCFLIFQEHERFPRSFAIAFAFQVLLGFILRILSLSEAGVPPNGVAAWLGVGLDVLQLLFVGFAMYWTIKGWRADLVDDRRILRWFIIGVQGALIFSVVFVETFLLSGGAGESAAARSVIVYAVALLALGMLIVALRFDSVSLTSVIRKVTELTEEPIEESSSSFDIASFNKSFSEGKLYREAGLTISMLAKKLSLPEYRLRAFIHKQLGFRNFNAMLHKYRIEDAKAELAAKDNANVPVLTIALTVGYQSITPFNNAFRQITGVTPSEYRKRHATD